MKYLLFAAATMVKRTPLEVTFIRKLSVFLMLNLAVHTVTPVLYGVKFYAHVMLAIQCVSERTM